jgi:hypothetical protein
LNKLRTLSFSQFGNKMHERSNEGTYGAAFLSDSLHVAPVDPNAHIIVAAAMLSMRQTVPAPGARPPFFVPSPRLTTDDFIASFQELHEQLLTGGCECINPNVCNLDGKIIERIVLFSIDKLLQVLMIRCGNSCVYKKPICI